MKFTHDFREDLETILHEIDHGEPFAFSRFGDGELALIQNRQIRSADGWEVPEKPTEFTASLLASLRYEDDRYYVGLGCGCNDSGCCAGVQDELLGLALWKSHDNITTSNIFANGNFDHIRNEYFRYPRYEKLSEFFVISPWTDYSDMRVPVNAVNMRNVVTYVTEEVIPQLYNIRRPILVAAGPVTNVIIHEYWRLCGRTTIVDIGSALNLNATGRGYHDENHPNRKKMCKVFPE